ncbi:hypothetical protein OC861_006802, partial [Tilletia horrida]
MLERYADFVDGAERLLRSLSDILEPIQQQGSRCDMELNGREVKPETPHAEEMRVLQADLVASKKEEAELS